MSFPRYPDYKDSGVKWLGAVPRHWQVLPLKRDIAFLTSGSRGWAEHYSDEGALFLRIGNLTRDGIGLDLSDIQRVDVPDGVEGERTRVEAGDVLFSITAYLGSVAFVPTGLETAYVSQHVALARLHKALFLPEWVAYVVSSWIGKTYLETQGYGGTKVQLSLEDVANTLVTVPPLSEQLAIATFIRYEVAKIDGLMTEQEKLITLLKEKRQAVISHAVTKGLDPAVPMKKSGVEWLGEVPAHWQVSRVKYLVNNFDQGWSPQCESFPVTSADEWGVLKVGCVNGGIFSPEENKSLPPELDPLPELGIRQRDLLISRANTRELVGSAAVALRDYPNLLLCDKLYRLRLDAATRAEFVAYYLSIGQVRGQIELSASGASSSMLNISQATILELAIALPTDEEQGEIVAFIESEQIKLNALISGALQAINLLKERRTALISAAVTGQIDVRGLAKDEQEQAA